MKKELERLGGAIKETVLFPFKTASTILYGVQHVKAMTKAMNDKNSSIGWFLRNPLYPIITEERRYKRR